MKIEIWSDVVCPFCYIGKRKLEKALEKFPQKDKVEIEWKSFQLNPDQKTNPHEIFSATLAWRLTLTDCIGWREIDVLYRTRNETVRYLLVDFGERR